MYFVVKQFKDEDYCTYEIEAGPFTSEATAEKWAVGNSAECENTLLVVSVIKSFKRVVSVQTIRSPSVRAVV